MAGDETQKEKYLTGIAEGELRGTLALSEPDDGADLDYVRMEARAAIQVLAGTGFTWEHDLYFFLKRAKANEVMMGDAVYHREEIARIMEEEK